MENHKRKHIIQCARFDRAMLFNILIIMMLFLPYISPAQESDSAYEATLAATIEDLVQGKLVESLSNINQLLEEYPNSKLAYKLLGDILSIRASKELLETDYIDQASLIQGYNDEIKRRWSRIKQLSPVFSGLQPSNLIQASPAHEYILVIDSHASRAYVYQNNDTNYTLVTDHYITVGKEGMSKSKEGDLKTPIGVYFVTNYLPGEALPDRYGPGAFPIDYPNEYDKGLNRTGYGIWLHGTESDNYSRVPNASDGCVTFSNDDFLKISKYIKSDGNTPVIISDHIKWTDPQETKGKRYEYMSLINNWATDIEGLDADKYLSHYSREKFHSGAFDYGDWAKHKRKIVNGKEYITIKLSDISIYEYPGSNDMLLFSFVQEYNSNNYSDVTRKKQYWQKNIDGEWQITNEISI